jgi:hypothetical protein
LRHDPPAHAEAGFKIKLGCHVFRATGITAYLEAGGTLEKAQAMAAHESPRTTKLYDRRGDEITLDEVYPGLSVGLGQSGVVIGPMCICSILTLSSPVFLKNNGNVLPVFSPGVKTEIGNGICGRPRRRRARCATARPVIGWVA